MGIYIGIKRIKSKDHRGCYEGSTNDFGVVHFFMRLDTLKKCITFYRDNRFHEQLKEVDCTLKDAPLEDVSSIPRAVLWRVTLKAMSSFELENFPKYLSYEA